MRSFWLNFTPQAKLSFRYWLWHTVASSSLSYENKASLKEIIKYARYFFPTYKTWVKTSILSHKTNGYFLIKSFWYYGKSLIFGNCQLLIIYCFKDSSILLQDIEIYFKLFNVCDLFYNKNIYILLLCFFQFDKYKIHLIECKGWQAKTGKNKSVLDVKNKTHLFSKSFHLFLVAIYMSCNWYQITFQHFSLNPCIQKIMLPWSEGLRESGDIEILPLWKKTSSHCE